MPTILAFITRTAGAAFAFIKGNAPRMGADTGGLKMTSELISYAVLASIFVVTGLRIFIDKPGKPPELPFLRSEHKTVNENDPLEHPEG